MKETIFDVFNDVVGRLCREGSGSVDALGYRKRFDEAVDGEAVTMFKNTGKPRKAIITYVDKKEKHTHKAVPDGRGGFKVSRGKVDDVECDPTATCYRRDAVFADKINEMLEVLNEVNDRDLNK